jgi:thioredoxin reductase
MDGPTASPDCLVVGGGVAGLTAATFTARAGLDTLVVADGESILARNAHLENVPGFPAGVDPRLFLDLLTEQSVRAGARLASGRVVGLDASDDGFTATVTPATRDPAADWPGPDEPRPAAPSEIRAAAVVAASWADTGYLDGLGLDLRTAGSKRFVAADRDGRTTVPGLYAAGRLAERYHQAVVAAGDGATAGLSVVHDSTVPHYNDWVVPAGYFTDRGREVPPGCEEVDADERAARAAESRTVMLAAFAGDHPSRQRTHPSLVDDDHGRVPEE